MNFWSYITADRITAFAAVVGIVVSIWVLQSQLSNSRFALSVDTLLKMEERFNSPDMVKKRKKAAKALLGKTHHEDADDVLDFLETIGIMVHRGALDEEMVWNTFFYWVDGYWEAAQSHIQEEQKKNPEVWRELEYLEKRCLTFEDAKMKGRAAIPVPKQEFLKDEAEL